MVDVRIPPSFTVIPSKQAVAAHWLASRRKAGEPTVRLVVRGKQAASAALSVCQDHAAVHGPLRVHDVDGWTRGVERLTRTTDDVETPNTTSVLEVVFGPTPLVVQDVQDHDVTGPMPNVMPASGELIVENGDGRVFFYGEGAVIAVGASSTPAD